MARNNSTPMVRCLFSSALSPLAVAVSVVEEFVPATSCVNRGTCFDRRRILTGMLLWASVLLVEAIDAVMIPAVHLPFMTGLLPE